MWGFARGGVNLVPHLDGCHRLVLVLQQLSWEQPQDQQTNWSTGVCHQPNCKCHPLPAWKWLLFGICWWSYSTGEVKTLSAQVPHTCWTAESSDPFHSPWSLIFFPWPLQMLSFPFQLPPCRNKRCWSFTQLTSNIQKNSSFSTDLGPLLFLQGNCKSPNVSLQKQQEFGSPHIY